MHTMVIPEAREVRETARPREPVLESSTANTRHSHKVGKGVSIYEGHKASTPLIGEDCITSMDNMGEACMSLLLSTPDNTST